jgi:hypothetical protein
MVEKVTARLAIAILIAGCAGVSVSARAGVINGNFSSGNTGFTSGYGFGPTGGGHYTVGNNPKTWNSFLSSYGDHTTGSGLMLIADGSGTANTRVWTESIAVTPATQYTFTFWASSNGNDNANGIDPSPAILVATANGTSFGSAFHVPQTNGVWSQFTGTFNSGVNSVVSMSITDSNTNGGAGNDFAIDDVALVPEPGSFFLLLLTGCALPFWRRRKRAVA